MRVSDGQKASLKIGQRVPVATGSFQAGVGVGVGGGAGVVNPLVNTQFQYIDVGVNIDVTPRVIPDGEVSMKLSIDVSQFAGTSNIGGIQQPIISQRKIEHDIRLKDGEVNVLGGLIERDTNKNLNGIPGLSEIPLARYLSSDITKEVIDQEILIVLTPHIIRLPSISQDDLRTMAAGTDTNVRVYRDSDEGQAPATIPRPPQPSGAQPVPGQDPQSPAMNQQPPPGAENQAAQLRFDPANVRLKPGDRMTLGLAVANVKDLYSIPLLIHYNPAIVQVEEVRDGGFLSGGTQQIAIVQRIDSQRGEVIVSATRQPNTPGVNGSGTLLGIMIRGVAAGNSDLQILQVNAHDSQQRTIPVVSRSGHDSGAVSEMSGARHSSRVSRDFSRPFGKPCRPNRRVRAAAAGMTLLELIIACGILLVLASVALPLERVTLVRRRETKLRYDLRQIRDAIDRYKDASDKNLIKVAAGTEGYPPDLDTLVKRHKAQRAAGAPGALSTRDSRRSMTKTKDWGMRSVQDDPDSTSWGGQDVFDVYSKATGTALDGTKYSEW